MDVKLFSLLQNLDKKELTDLQKFVNSPYHNRHQGVISLFNFLRKNIKNDIASINKDKVFSHIFPGEKFDNLKLRHVMSYLQQVVESYLEIHEMEGDHFGRKLNLLKVYSKKNLKKHFRNTRVLLNKYDEKHGKRNLQFHLQKFQFYSEVYDDVASSNRSGEFDLQNLTDSLDTFYVASKLKIACNVLMFKNLFKKEHDIQLFQEVMDLVVKERLDEIPIIGIYYHAYLTLTKPEEEESFFNLKSQLSKNGHLFTLAETRDIYLLAINHCIRRLNDGNAEYLAEVFSLYESSLANGALLIEGKLSPYTYINIASAAIRLHNYDWAGNFIEEYKAILNTVDVDSFYTYVMAQWLFATKKYNEVTDLLLQKDINDFFSQLQARVLLLKSYYELSEFDLMDSGVENFRQLIGRRKILAYHKSNYTNFARYLKRLSRLNVYNKEDVQSLKQKVSEEKVLTEKPWFMEKINELIK